MSQQYRPEIDGLRSIAVGSVIIYHLWPNALPGGFLGVDVFFVISGYIISRLIYTAAESGSFSFGDFYLRRLRRIVPAQLLVIALCLAIFPHLLSAREMGNVGESAAYSVLSLGNVYFWLESGYWGALSQPMPLLHTWSLAVEEQFYLVWPVALIALTSITAWGVRAALVAGVALASLVAAIWFYHADAAGAFYLFPFRIFEFVIGAVFGLFAVPSIAPVLARSVAAASLCVLGACFWLFHEGTPHPGLRTLVPCLASAGLIYATAYDPLSRRLLASRPLVHLGLLSYSLYLVHWPLIVAAKLIYGDEISLRLGLELAGLTYAGAALMHYLWEKPLRYGQIGRLSFQSINLGLIGVFFVATTAYASTFLGGPQRDAGSADARRELVIEQPADLAKYPHDILIFGDSHADVMTRVINQVLATERAPYKLAKWTFHGCPSLFKARRIYEPNLAERQRKCWGLAEQWEEAIPKSKAKVVVIASRWAWLTEPQQYYNDNMRQAYLVRKEDDPQTHELSASILRKALKDTVDTLTAAGKTVIVVHQVPPQTNRAVRCLERLKPGQNPLQCHEAPLRLAKRRLETSRSAIEDAVAGNNNAYSINPFPYFCDNRMCRAYISGIRLYGDNTHLNADGQRYLAKKIDSRLMMILHRALRPATS